MSLGTMTDSKTICNPEGFTLASNVTSTCSSYVEEPLTTEALSDLLKEARWVVELSEKIRKAESEFFTHVLLHKWSQIAEEKLSEEYFPWHKFLENCHYEPTLLGKTKLFYKDELLAWVGELKYEHSEDTVRVTRDSWHYFNKEEVFSASQ